MITWLKRRKYKSDFEIALNMIWFSTIDLPNENTAQVLIRNITEDPNLPKLLEDVRTGNVTPYEAVIALAQAQFSTLYSGPASIFTDGQRDQIREIFLNSEPPTAEERPDTRPFFLFMLEHALYTISNWMMHDEVDTRFFKSFLDTIVKTFSDSSEEQIVIHAYLLTGAYAYRDWIESAVIH
jgi:hypothetical protein